jgi:hypothetical protein
MYGGFAMPAEPPVKRAVAFVDGQNLDLSEVAAEIREIAREQSRWINAASVFPCSPALRNARGIDKTDWIRIDRATYDACLDRRDYRAKLSPGEPT